MGCKLFGDLYCYDDIILILPIDCIYLCFKLGLDMVIITAIN